MKRIVTCSDGTWNKPGVETKGQIVATNVQKLFATVCKVMSPADGSEPIHQIKYYDEGVGAEGTAWSKLIDGATGAGIDDNIKDIYRFIVWNYEPGDELFLFGFSRGAYTARSLVGLIRNCGILINNDLTLINTAYDIYRDRDDPKKNPNGEISTAFRAKHSHPDTSIKFVGVWDTVGALGIPVRAFQFLNKNQYQFHDTTLSSIVENAYQALAVEEERSNFQPALWTIDPTKPLPTGQTMKQVWFSGVHSNVGGGYPDHGLSDLTLKWMSDQARSCGLGFDEPQLASYTATADITGELYNSNGFPFSLLAAYVRPVMKTTGANESIDPSVFERMRLVSGYEPKNIDKPS
ncbi:MAG: DUF2235 domain-containing protein [Mucilaginibacter sp.]|uniref:DUF2235 domain-containing protein n=1 Tax=Mucilaginibacter sp. TaxID=1882438 RepID=UPI0032639F6D